MIPIWAILVLINIIVLRYLDNRAKDAGHSYGEDVYTYIFNYYLGWVVTIVFWVIWIIRSFIN